jgi:hypothetical protein
VKELLALRVNAAIGGFFTVGATGVPAAAAER